MHRITIGSYFMKSVSEYAWIGHTVLLKVFIHFQK